MDAGRLAFISAMPMELKPLVKKLGLQKETVGDVEVHTGALDGRAVVAIYTGMGTDLATKSTEALLDAVDVDRVIVHGITGALENETPIGALIVPEVVVHSETGAEHRPDQLGGIAPKGTMWTTNVLITGRDQLAALRGRGVVSLDMETAAIAESCERRDIPWSVFRVISDRASDGSVDEEVFKMSNQDGSPNPAAVAKYFLRHPNHVGRMAKLAKGAKLATEAAADAAIEAARALPR
jgi:adenosylhomocysteine nucleosidase